MCVVPLGLVVAALGASCGGKNAEVQVGDKVMVQPEDGAWSVLIEDSHFGGAANGIRMVAMSYGRLVHVTARDGAGVVRIEGGALPGSPELVIRQGLRSVPGEYELSRDPITGRETLYVDRNVDVPAERSELEDILVAASTNLDPIQVRDLASTDVFSMVPRNAAIVVRFDDMLDPDSVDERTVQLLTGDPPSVPSTPFQGRVFPLSFFGGRTPLGRRYPTRVVIDTTVSEVEAAEGETIQGINPVGLPASTNPGLANVELRVPSRRISVLGLGKIVVNLSGAGMTTDGGGPVDFSSPARPLTRAFRSGGRPGIVEDPGAGFLSDDDAPVLVGSTPVEILGAPIQVGGARSPIFVIPALRFVSARCAGEPESPDVIVQGSVFARVEPAAGQPGGTFPDPGGVTRNVRVRLISYPALDGVVPEDSYPALWASTALGPATYESAFDPVADRDRAPCFVRATPLAVGAPGDLATGIQPDTIFTMRFSEPMDPSSLTAFDSVTLARAPFDPVVGPDASDVVVGRLQPSADRRDVTFLPRQPLSHAEGAAEAYYLRIADGTGGTVPPRDLGGNPVQGVPEIRFTIDPGASTVLNGGRVQRFSSLDEAPPLGNEWGGQILIDQDRQVLRPRPMLRSTAVIDDGQPMLAAQFDPPAGGVVTPLSPFGSRLQAMWRYVDCGFSLSDQQDMNIDIEGLSWAPAGGSVVADEFDQFEMALGHSRRSPDEVVDPANGFPRFPNSGLSASFGDNVLNSDRADVQSLAVVHDRGRGYAFDTGDLYQASTGTTLVPFPLNRGVPFAERRYFTWRDTRIRARGVNQNNGGTEPLQWFQARGLPLPPPVGTLPGYRPYYGSSDGAQTAGLPLLMEFRVFPDLTSAGQNPWEINIAINSSRNPFFRAFSTGGIDTSNATNTVDPTDAPTATGGYDPMSMPSPGATTPGLDPVVYIGAIDYITRVSQAHSVWFEATIAGEGEVFGGRTFDEPTIEPSLDLQPAGTDLRTEFRGATGITYLNDEAAWGQELADWVAAGGTPQSFAGTDPLEGGADNDGDPQDNDPTPGVPDFMADAFSLDLYGDYYNDSDNWSDLTLAPPVPRIPSMWPRHYTGLANPGISFQIDGTWFQDVGAIEDARFYQVRLTFVGNPETGRSPEVSAFGMTWSR